ncbi:MAG: hypothetical protein LBH70_06630 [Spirochaetaceae bacterium]|nr:hypothetical protein [Spirochaetaceae bacterium]
MINIKYRCGQGFSCFVDIIHNFGNSLVDYRNPYAVKIIFDRICCIFTCYNHTDKRVIENLCEITYGFFKDNDGNLIARSGLPFMFSIEIAKLNHNVENIRFDSAEILLNNTIINMFQLNDVDYEANYIVWEGTDTKKSKLNNKK